MLFSIRLVVFALVGFSPGNTIPGPTLSRISRLPLAVVVDQAGFQLNRLLLQERQDCAATCGQATVSPYDTYCCEKGQFCTTVSGIPTCSAESQAYSCFATCGQATVSPYDTYCCEEGDFCTTVSGTPMCSSSTSPTPTGITQPSSS